VDKKKQFHCAGFVVNSFETLCGQDFRAMPSEMLTGQGFQQYMNNIFFTLHFSVFLQSLPHADFTEYYCA